jgi:hypothetical protein
MLMHPMVVIKLIVGLAQGLHSYWEMGQYRGKAKDNLLSAGEVEYLALIEAIEVERPNIYIICSMKSQTRKCV